MPKDKPLRKHHLRAAPEDLVSVMEDRFQAEAGIVDDEVRVILCLCALLPSKGLFFAGLRSTSLFDLPMF